LFNQLEMIDDHNSDEVIESPADEGGDFRWAKYELYLDPASRKAFAALLEALHSPKCELVFWNTHDQHGCRLVWEAPDEARLLGGGSCGMEDQDFLARHYAGILDSYFLLERLSEGA